MGFERVRREYGARLLFFFCVAFCLFSIVYRLSSIVFFVFMRLVRVLWRIGARGAAARRRANQSMCVRAIVRGHFFFFRFGLVRWVVRGAGAMPRGVGDDVGGGPRC